MDVQQYRQSTQFIYCRYRGAFRKFDMESGLNDVGAT